MLVSDATARLDVRLAGKRAEARHMQHHLASTGTNTSTQRTKPTAKGDPVGEVQLAMAGAELKPNHRGKIDLVKRWSKGNRATDYTFGLY